MLEEDRGGAPSPLHLAAWRPIETCPTDMAAEVDLKLPDGSEWVGMFSWPSGQWRRWVGDVTSPTDLARSMRVFSPLPDGVYPTHWRPRGSDERSEAHRGTAG